MEQHRTGPVFRRIVVGIDGSQGSLDAFAWAVAVARAGGGEVVPVQAWLPGPSPEDATELARTRHEEAFLQAVRDVNATGVAVHPVFVVGDRFESMKRVCANADLVVLGSQRHHGLARMVLGSLAAQLTGEVSAPVVVMPPPDLADRLRHPLHLSHRSRHGLLTTSRGR
jgi:nucleotide-binding universal stress UspA family protein